MDDNNSRGYSTVVGRSIAPILEVVRGNERGRILHLGLKTRIGREHENDLILTDPRASRFHALIHLVEGQWVVRDEGSINGTFVNDKKVSGGQPLKPGDRITLGDTELVFQPSQVGLGSRTASAPAGTSLAVVDHRHEDESPQWGWFWIAGGLALIVVLVAVIVVVRTGGRMAVRPSSSSTATVDNLVDGFVLSYEDDFSDPSSGWDDAFDRNTVKQYGNNKYYVEVTTSNLVAWGLANRDVADFRLQVDATQESGPNNNGYGVLFRFGDRDNYYRFDISGEGFFLLSKFNEGEWTTLVPWTASSAINVGQTTNTLMVEAIGDRIRIFANGVDLAEAQDDSLAHGNFGFFANTFSDPNLIVSFDNIKLWTPRGEAMALIPTVTPTRFMPTPTAALVPEAEVVAEPTDDTRLVDTIEVEAPTPESTAGPVVVVTSAPPATPSPTPLPLPEYASRDVPLARNAVSLTGRFCFPVFDSETGTYNVFLANVDGSDRELVVEDASQPRLNSDGTRIAFRSWKADSRGLIERAVADGDGWRFNSFFESARPVYAPGDQSFLFHSREGGAEPAIYRTTGAEHQVLRREGGPIQGESPAWVDNDRFVYKGCLGGDCGLILSNVDGSFPTQLTQDPSDVNPDVSPDGQNIVFMSRRSGNWDVYVVGIDGSGLSQLTSDVDDDGLPIWLTDGTTIAFVSDRDSVWAMWAMDADGDNHRPLFELEGSIDGVVQADVQNARGWTEETISWTP